MGLLDLLSRSLLAYYYRREKIFQSILFFVNISTISAIHLIFQQLGEGGAFGLTISIFVNHITGLDGSGLLCCQVRLVGLLYPDINRQMRITMRNNSYKTHLCPSRKKAELVGEGCFIRVILS